MFIKDGFDAVSLRRWGFVSFGSSTMAGFPVFLVLDCLKIRFCQFWQFYGEALSRFFCE